MGPDEPTTQLVLQRIHNQIMEYLEIAASFEEQREYQRKVPVSVSNEIINQWEDSVVEPIDSAEYPDPAFDQAERDAMVEFHRVWTEVADRTPNPLPDLEVVIQMPEWSRLRDAAGVALAVFRRRGALPEDDEIVAS